MADFSASTRAPASPPAPNPLTANAGQSIGAALTPSGKAYAAAHNLGVGAHAEFFRKAVADRIEDLIAVLDALDPDPDLEPSLAGFDKSPDDREGDPCDQGEDVDEDGAPWREAIDQTVLQVHL